MVLKSHQNFQKVGEISNYLGNEGQSLYFTKSSSECPKIIVAQKMFMIVLNQKCDWYGQAG